LVACGILVGVAPTAFSAEEPSATPYRPTVSNPAALSAPGYFEVEAGFLRARNDDPRRRDRLPVLLKYAFTENVGLLIGGESYVKQYSHIDGRITGLGDSTLTLKLHHPVNDTFNIGVEAGVKVPTAKDRIGSGKRDGIVNGIMSAELGAATVDLNLGAMRLGVANPGESRTVYTWAAALSHPIGERWGVAGEFSGLTQQGVPSTAQFLAAVTYTISKRVVLDAGAPWRLTKASTDRAVFAGVTVLLR
jgi:hypothetical protein